VQLLRFGLRDSSPAPLDKGTGRVGGGKRPHHESPDTCLAEGYMEVLWKNLYC
jgi:hypothetical protein